MGAIEEICSVCAQSFEVTFRYQMEERDGGFAFYCSQSCLERSHGPTDEGDTPLVTCDACAKRFRLSLASQVLYVEGRRRYACGMSCRSQLLREADGARLEEFATRADGEAKPAAAPLPDAERRSAPAAPRPSASRPRSSKPGAERGPRNGWARLETVAAADGARPSAPAAPEPSGEGNPGRPRRAAVPVSTTPQPRTDRPRSKVDDRETALWAPKRIAVFNHKGGTGKTTTSVSLAAGLAAGGKRVLLVDTDSQGNVAVSLGKSAERSLYHVLVMGLRVSDATSEVRPGLDLLPSNETLAAAELYLAGRQNRDRVLSQRMDQAVRDYDYVIIDCSPSLSLMNQNALTFADSVLVPVACDYLSLVGVRQVIKTVRNVNHLLHHKLQIWGVLPTFYDVRAKICAEALETLRNHFGIRCLPPVRATTRLKEAPARAQSIFEYAPVSNGSDDYRDLVERVRAGHPGATIDVPRPAGSPRPRHSNPGLGCRVPAVASA